MGVQEVIVGRVEDPAKAVKILQSKSSFPAFPHTQVASLTIKRITDALKWLVITVRRIR